MSRTGLFTEAAKARAHIDAGGVKKVLISAPAKGPDVTLAIGINLESLRPAEAPRHLQRLAAPPTAWRRSPRCCTTSFGIINGMMTTIHSLHQRPAHPRPAAQGSAARARGGAVDDPDHHRRRQGAVRGAPGARGQARRLRHAGADAERLGGRPHGAPGEAGHRRSRSTTPSAPPQGPALHGRARPSPTSRWCPCDYNGDAHSATVDLGRRRRSSATWSRCWPGTTTRWATPPASTSWPSSSRTRAGLGRQGASDGERP